MLKESIALRYAQAAYALARERGCLEAVMRDMDGIAELLARDPDLASYVASPVVGRDAKAAALRAALDGKVNEVTLNLLVLLVRKRRENLLAIIARQLHELHDQEIGRTIAAISTALPLDDAHLQELAARLSGIYRTTIVPHTKLAPDLLGGVVVQVGDRYVDASVAGRLEELRRHLLAVTDRWMTASPNGKPGTDTHP